MIIKKTAREIELMRTAGRIVALAHQEVAKHIAPGVSTLAAGSSISSPCGKHSRTADTKRDCCNLQQSLKHFIGSGLGAIPSYI